MRFLLPDALLTDAGTLRRGHGLAVGDDGRIADVLAADERPPAAWTRFPGEAWTAAPVMAHAHLESWDAPAHEWPRTSFAAWARALVAWRDDGARLDAAASARRSLDALGATGCGLVATHVGEAAAAGAGRTPPPDVHALPELFAPDPAAAAALLADPAVARALVPGSTGVALHAPFSVSEDLARAVFRHARASGVPVSIHLGEHAEERACLRDGGGPLAALLRERGHPPKAARWSSPVDWLADVGGLQPGTLAVHAGDLDAGELRRLEGAGVRVAWCPGTHRWFGRARPAFVAGLPEPPALGCDSRASNDALDPLRELRLAAEAFPEWSAAAWWRALTEGGARAVGRGDLGRLAAGQRAWVLRLRDPLLAEAADAEALCARLAVAPPAEIAWCWEGQALPATPGGAASPC